MLGLMSRCTMPRSCAKSEAAARLADHVERLGEPQRQVLARASTQPVEGTAPGSISIAMYMIPRGSSPSSCTVTMFGWFSLAAALASRTSKRFAPYFSGDRSFLGHESLDRDLALERLPLEPAVDHAHAAAAHALDDFVAT